MNPRQRAQNMSRSTNQDVSSTETPVKKHRPPHQYSEVIRTAKSDTGMLPAFLITPKNVFFDAQDENEKILLLLRKHIITNVPWVVAVIIGLAMPILFTYIPAFLLLPDRFQIVTIIIWYLLVFGYALEAFLGWYYHVFIITDERIIDYDFYSLLYKRVSKAKIDRIEDVTYEMGGILQNIFHFGYVFIQTAGQEREFQFESIPNPGLVAKLLNELMLEEEREKIEGRVR